MSKLNYIQINQLQEKLEHIRKDIVNHSVFKTMNTPEDMHVFMQIHVWAVWDFMSLLKALQRSLTCINVPWVPRGNAEIRYLINEIVAGEESDVDELGQRWSHYEMYIHAMQQSGANTQSIETFVNRTASGISLYDALQQADIDAVAREFVEFTFEIIATGKPHIIAAVFTFGREDLIPEMFTHIVSDLRNQFPNKFSKLDYYLQRHIDVDGGHHGHLALEMVSTLCGTDQTKWNEAGNYSIKALYFRRKLWDRVLEQISVPAL
jgi:hypothetical protein